MVLHPPMLYMGYVGFSVALCLCHRGAAGRPARRRLGALDAPWTTAAWIFLTFGIGLGSWWAYYELGWGGWWFWDPVENASFMPWLVGTALIHSLAVTEKRGGFKAGRCCWPSWPSRCRCWAPSSCARACCRRCTRSPPTRAGLFILAFLVVPSAPRCCCTPGARPRGLGPALRPGVARVDAAANNMLLAVATGAVLLGTLYPLFLDAMGMGKISVGPPYFDTVFFLLMAPLLVMLGIGPLARWKDDDLGSLAVVCAGRCPRGGRRAAGGLGRGPSAWPPPPAWRWPSGSWPAAVDRSAAAKPMRTAVCWPASCRRGRWWA